MKNSLTAALLSLTAMALIEMGKDAKDFWYPSQGLRCYPIVVHLDPPVTGFERKVIITYDAN